MSNVELYDALTALGRPIFTAPSGGPSSEFTRPHGWQQLTPEGNAARLAAARAGSAFMVVLGGALAVVDVDVKNDASISDVRDWLVRIEVEVYAEVATPSDGRHFYVAGHPDLPNVSADKTRDGLEGLPGVEVLFHGRNVYLPGTKRRKDGYEGKGYTVLSNDLQALVGGDPTSGAALAEWVSAHRAVRDAEQYVVGQPWAGQPLSQREQAYLDAVLTGMNRELAAMPTGSGRNHKVYVSGLKCGNYIAGAGMDEGRVVETLLDACRQNGLVAEDTPAGVLASIRSGIRNGKVRPRAVPPPPKQKDRRTATASVKPSPGKVATRDPRARLGELLDHLRGWQDLPDPTHILAALGAAATRDSEGEACWLLLVAPPSSGKTETVRMLDDAADARLDEVTAAGLLGWSKGKTARPIGVLTRVGERGLITFGDLSSLLATSDRGGRDQVFGMLRRVYDGHAHRDISPPGRTEGGEVLEWKGRLTVVACVTGAIDRYTAHNDQLGPRWLYVRIPERNTEAKRRAATLARRVNLTEFRAEAAEMTARLLEGARERLPDDLPETVEATVANTALTTAWGRGSVPRNGYGRREIDGVPVVEEPMRLIQQLRGIARGLTALGLHEHTVQAVIRRVGLDSMPAARRAVLVALSTGEVLSTAGVGREAHLDRKVARMTLEELAAIGVVEHDRESDDQEELAGTVRWSLSGDDGKVIVELVEEWRRDVLRGWDEMWVHPTPPPLNRSEDAYTREQPTFRPTPEQVIASPPAEPLPAEPEQTIHSTCNFSERYTA